MFCILIHAAWKTSQPVSNVRNKIAGLAQAYAAAALTAIASPERQQPQNGQPEAPDSAVQEPQQVHQESLQGSAGPAPKTALEAAREVVGAMATALGGENSPSKSGDEAHISPLGAQLAPTQKQQEQPESSAGRRREAEETEAMPPPPLPTQQQQQQQFLLPTQPQNLPSGTDGTAPMDIDESELGNQDISDDLVTETNNTTERQDSEHHGDGETTRPNSPLQSADIAQLPVTQPIPYGGTPPEALNKIASVQGEAMYGEAEGEDAEAEEVSPDNRAKAAETVAAMLAEREQQLQITQPQVQEEEEEPEPLMSPTARGWLGTIMEFGAKLAKSKRTPPAGGAGAGATPPAGGAGAGAGVGVGGGRTGNKKGAPTPVFGSLPPAGGSGGRFGGARGRHLTEGIAPAPEDSAGWNLDVEGLQPTQAMPQSTNDEGDNNYNNLNNTKGKVMEGVNGKMNPRDQHLATSIDARLDAGGLLGGANGGGGGGEGAASPMRPPPPFHQPSSVEALDLEEEDGDVEQGGEVEEGAHGGTGVETRGGIPLATADGAITGVVGGLVQRASSSVAQTGAAAAVAAAHGAGVVLGGRSNINNFSAAIGVGGPLTQDFHGVTATQEDIEAILGSGGATVEDAGNAIVGGEAREPSLAPAEPSHGPGNAILKGRDISKNGARTTGAMEKQHHRAQGEDEEEDEQDDGVRDAEVQTSPEKPRRVRRRGAEELSDDDGSGDVTIPGIVYAKKRKTNPTKRTTRAALAAEAAAVAATTGSTGVSEDEKEGIMPDVTEGGGGYYDASMPPPPVVMNPELAEARDMPMPRGPTPAAQLPSTRALAAREKLHALIRQRQILSASPSAAGAGHDDTGVPLSAGVYQGGAAGGLRVAVQRPDGAVVVSGGGSGPNSVDYRTPRTGQTPVYSVLAPGGGIAARRAYVRPQRQQRQRPQPSAASGGGGAAAKSTLSSLLGL